jgi:nucleoside-diphosphate kinase
MTRGPVMLVALRAENAVQRYRDVIGATDPAKAAEGTVRKLYGTDVGENAVHGSDSEENGRIECGWFFPGHELV